MEVYCAFIDLVDQESTPRFDPIMEGDIPARLEEGEPRLTALRNCGRIAIEKKCVK